MGEKGGNCRRSNVSYQIVCQECGEDQVIAHYKGETSRNMYTRGLEHLGQLKSKKTDSPLWSHCQSHHSSKVVNFTMEMAGVFTDPLSRQVMEGVQINSFKGVVMNRKAARRQPAVSRVQFVRDVE